MSDLVFNIRPASASAIRAMDRHERDRSPDGASAIDPARSHLNETLHGSDAGPLAALDDLYEGGVKRPAKQAESPYLQIVLSASPQYFRPSDPEARGTWDQDRLHAWRDRTMKWLREEFGGDLVHAALHLDEDTPHVHALVAPTYSKKPRVPGRRRKSETEEEFQERRRAAQESDGVRTVGRASHPELSQPGSFQRLRERLAVAVHDLGIEYGQDRTPDAPDGQTTREWVREQAAQVKADRAQIERERSEIAAERSRLAGVRDTVERLMGAVADRLGVGDDLRAIRDALIGVEDPLSEPDPDPDPKNPGSPSDIARMIAEARGDTPDSDGPDIEM
jgi:hypothetical protein